MNKQKTVIIIAGPTGSGKTDLSLQLAAHQSSARDPAKHVCSRRGHAFHKGPSSGLAPP